MTGMPRALLLLLGILLGPTTAIAATASPAAPIAVRDDAGRTVSFPQIPTRIVSLAPSQTEILFVLGLGDRLVAVNEWSDYPAEARSKPQVRGLRPSLEQLVSLRPDLILTVGGMADVVSQFEEGGLPVLVLAPRSVVDAYRNIETLAKLMRVPGRGRAVIEAIREKVADVRTRVGSARRPRVYYEVDAADPVRPFSAGPGTIIHELLLLAGSENVAGTARVLWPQLSLEQLLRADPEIIILGDAINVNVPQTPEMLMRRPGWEGLTAVRRRAIRPVDGAVISRPGPRIGDGLEALARAIHPDRFSPAGSSAPPVAREAR